MTSNNERYVTFIGALGLVLFRLSWKWSETPSRVVAFMITCVSECRFCAEMFVSCRKAESNHRNHKSYLVKKRTIVLNLSYYIGSCHYKLVKHKASDGSLMLATISRPTVRSAEMQKILLLIFQMPLEIFELRIMCTCTVSRYLLNVNLLPLVDYQNRSHASTSFSQPRLRWEEGGGEVSTTNICSTL